MMPSVFDQLEQFLRPGKEWVVTDAGNALVWKKVTITRVEIKCRMIESIEMGESFPTQHRGWYEGEVWYSPTDYEGAPRGISEEINSFVYHYSAVDDFQMVVEYENERRGLYSVQFRTKGQDIEAEFFG
jgi:hypothetical protein